MLHRSARPRSQSWLLYALTALLLLITVAPATACPICYNAVKQVTIGQQLDLAERVVLALPTNQGSRFRILKVIKGNEVPDGIISEPVTGADAKTLEGDKPLLLLRGGPNQPWSSMGTIGGEYASWLRELAATLLVQGTHTRPAWPQTMQMSAELSDAGWKRRVALVLPYLENLEPLAAEIAFGEAVRAPYAALRTVRSRIDAATIAKWLDDPKLSSRSSAYLLLLGFAGSADDAVRLEQRIDAAWTSHDATNLAAMLAADLELRGPFRVDWIEHSYFADRKRTLPEIEAALLALNVHGGANATVPRDRVIQAYLYFIRERAPMAGFVALQLADWGYWDAAAEYAELLKSDVIKDPASRLAIESYLQRSAATKAALQESIDEVR